MFLSPTSVFLLILLACLSLASVLKFSSIFLIYKSVDQFTLLIVFNFCQKNLFFLAQVLIGY